LEKKNQSPIVSACYRIFVVEVKSRYILSVKAERERDKAQKAWKKLYVSRLPPESEHLYSTERTEKIGLQWTLSYFFSSCLKF